MWISGKLLQVVVGVINDQMTSELADRQLAQEQAAAAALAAVKVPVSTPLARRR